MCRSLLSRSFVERSGWHTFDLGGPLTEEPLILSEFDLLIDSAETENNHLFGLFLNDLIRQRSPNTSFDDDRGPATKAFDWLRSDSFSSFSLSNEQLIQRFAMATLYFSLNPSVDGYTGSRNWLEPVEECAFDDHDHWWDNQPNLECSSGTLTALSVDRSFSSPNGTLPLEIGLLTGLTALYASNIDVRGTIPSEIGGLTALTQLFLSGNRLSGTIPTEVGMLTEVYVLQLFANRLTGSVPSDTLNRLSSLRTMGLYYNELSGSIPNSSCEAHITVDCEAVDCNCCCDIYHYVKALIQSTNSYTSFSNPSSPAARSLVWLSADRYAKSNELSDERLIQRFAMAAIFYSVDPNYAHGDWSGSWLSTKDECNWDWFWDPENSYPEDPPVQCWSGHAWSGSSVTKLKLRFGNSGPRGIPSELALLTSLRELDISRMRIEGTIPSEIGLLNLGYFYLNNNRLTGQIPSELFHMVDLNEFTLHNNQLTGPVPTSAKFRNMAYLSLHGNMLTGTIAHELCTIPDDIDCETIIVIDCNDNLSCEDDCCTCGR